MFSPRMRGCSGAFQRTGELATVFPAYAGMFRGQGQCPRLWLGFPRVCGDVPILPHVFHAIPQFSPRMRGCSDHRR